MEWVSLNTGDIFIPYGFNYQELVRGVFVMFHRMIPFFVISVSCVSLLLFGTFYIPDQMISSVAILSGLVLIGWRYGFVSVPFIIAVVVFIPSLAFFWTQINGGIYINHMNHWLQDDQYYVNYAVYLSVVSLLCALLVYFSSRSIPKNDDVLVSSSSNRFDGYLFIISSAIAGFMFWLTDPGETLITASYEVLLTQRFEGTQFAGAVGLLFWLMAYQSFLSIKLNYKKKWIDRIAIKIFHLVTTFSLIWLLLHARRNELIGMCLVMVFVMAEKKGELRAGIVIVVTLVLLIVVEKIRSVALLGLLAQGFDFSASVDIVSLPGGASNVFMSFVDVIHYFDSNELYYGETFFNYVFQVLPTNLYSVIGITPPPIFSDTGVFDNYQWNGGVNGMSIFYANFGILGSVLYGVFVGLYVKFTVVTLKSRQLAIKVIGLYLIAIVFRGFWYEFITMIKPVLFMLLIHLVLNLVSQGYSSRSISLMKI